MIPDQQRATGCLPRTDQCGARHPIFEDATDLVVIPRASWPDVLPKAQGIRPLVAKIKDQGQEGTCASNATAQGFEIVWNQTFGLASWLEFSPIAIYRWIAPGPDSGSTISDNLEQLRNTGLLPVDTPATRTALATAGLDAAHVLDPTGYYQTFPTGWQNTAAVFRGFEYFDIATIEGFVSALCYGFPVVAGRSGHAICYVRARLAGSSVALDYANSWSPEWGDAGFGTDPLSKLEAAIGNYGAWALRGLNITDQTLAVLEAIGDQYG